LKQTINIEMKQSPNKPNNQYNQVIIELNR